MRYRVVCVKLNGASADGSPPEKPAEEKTLPRKTDDKLPKNKNVIMLQNQNNFIKKKSCLDKIINSEATNGFAGIDRKKPIQYALPRVRASFTFKVNPNQPESNPDAIKALAKRSTTAKATHVTFNRKLSHRYIPTLLEEELFTPDRAVITYIPRVQPQPTLAKDYSKPPKPILANRSSKTFIDDDKDFEIPLEESLAAVEEFIQREKELSKWSIGEDVFAMWKGNGVYYKAKILELLPATGTVVVMFDSYDEKDEIDHRDMCKYSEKIAPFKKKGRPPPVTPEEPRTNCKVCAQKLVATRKHKKALYKRIHLKSVFRTSKIGRKKLLRTYFRKNRKSIFCKSKRNVQKAAVEKLDGN